ncbi:uncharacterized protein EI90DRAFT_243737 [Cantharellus anzutake]|uniref:uncharacterized protein n=1 Tax=Cantharellus anzutake TaxID=1750568 RepID=UPI0019054162|nr:uncharacterized protein EI90DRAFT_243737 [Cantharellus anzutake]KAF8335682.1 hypothetical protein EI90DRAFT_243737 [Cantharellus anzutake]
MQQIPFFPAVNAINLTHVELHTYHPSIPNAINAATNLVYFSVVVNRLSTHVTSPVTGITALPFLRSLTLGGASMHHGLFPQSADRLETIQLINSKHPPPVLHSSQFPCLRLAAIDACNIDVNDLKDFFAHHPKLEHFSLLNLRDTHDPHFLECLCRDDLVLCPSLRWLQLDVISRANEWDRVFAGVLSHLHYIRFFQTSTPLYIGLYGISESNTPCTFQLATSKHIPLFLISFSDPFQPDWL